MCSITEKSLLIMWNYLQQRKTEEGKKQVEETHKRISPFFSLKKGKEPLKL